MIWDFDDRNATTNNFWEITAHENMPARIGSAQRTGNPVEVRKILKNESYPIALETFLSELKQDNQVLYATNISSINFKNIWNLVEEKGIQAAAEKAETTQMTPLVEGQEVDLQSAGK